MAVRDFEGLERRRMRAVRLFEQGETQSAVARRLDVSRTTAMRWAQAWDEQGREGLRAAGRAGRTPRLSEEQLQQIEDNNATERILPPIAVGRKNHYGSKSKRGTEVAALFYSLIESAKLAGVEPGAYLQEAAKRAIAKPRTATLPHDLIES